MGLTNKSPQPPPGSVVNCEDAAGMRTLRDLAKDKMNRGEYVRATTKRSRITGLYGGGAGSKSENKKVVAYLRAAMEEGIGQAKTDSLLNDCLTDRQRAGEDPIKRADLQFLIKAYNPNLPSGAPIATDLASLDPDEMFDDDELVMDGEWIKYEDTIANAQLGRDDCNWDMENELRSAMCHHNLRLILAEPVAADASRKAAETTKKIRAQYSTKPEKLREHANYKQLRDQRSNLSSTVRGGDDQSLKNFADAESTMLKLASTPNYRLSLDDVKAINLALTDNTKNNDGVPGELRSKPAAASGAGVYPYSQSEQIDEAMGETVAWINGELKKGRDPIEVAALANQRIVSIHPFADGNGRTARMVMDLLLVSNGLPPATLDDENTAVFGSKNNRPSGGTTEAVNKVRAGVENSAKILRLA